jgi:hypothetical protein
MTLSHFLRTALLIIVAAALVPLSASAQKRARTRKAPVVKKQHVEPETDYDPASDPDTAPEKSHEMPLLARQFLSEVGGIGLDFWTSRLNAYKARIDRTLNECDLAELNRMRVYWSMFLDNKGWNEIGLTGKRIFEGGGEEEGPDSPTAGNRVDALAQGIDKISELAETIFVARSIARRYRVEMNGIKDEMRGDLSRFVDTLIAAKEAFSAAHRAEIAADPETREGLEKIDRASLEEIAGKIGEGKEMGLIVGIVLEPVMMLYNGQDLRGLLKDIDVLPQELEGVSIPDNPVLAQSRPNPASGSAIISYTLPEPASKAVIRLFDARGELAGTFDQGPQTVGAHEAIVDVSTLSQGAYLYQLSVTTPQGERVYSRTMQVGR